VWNHGDVTTQPESVEPTDVVPVGFTTARRNVRFEAVTSLSGTHQALTVFQDAWGAAAAADFDTYFAVASHGGYLGLGWLDDEPVVAAFGFLSKDPNTGGRGLHSHMTATKRAHANSGLGFKMKQHQRQWARSNGIAAITWTYDPLQRRNARFNLVSLGATVVGFHRNLYGSLADSINEGVETDRFEVRLDVTTESGRVVNPVGDDLVVVLPESIDSLRASDPARARSIQLDLRNELAGLVDGTLCVRGMTADHAYVISRVS
jgi:predicted GNAT superfamily acetyltransferase